MIYFMWLRNKETGPENIFSDLNEGIRKGAVGKRYGIHTHMTRDPAKKGRKIVVYTKYRSGATFVSEMFNRHEDTYITFQPLNQLNVGEIDEYGLRVINDSLHCNFQNLEITPRPRRHEWVNYNVFCTLEQQTEGCPNITGFREAEIDCARHQHVATKLIHLPQIHTLLPLLAEGTKVLHVVRDPRAVLNSRRPIRPNISDNSLDIINNVNSYCNNILADMAVIRTARVYDSVSIDQNYHLLRYEDFAADPVQLLMDTYKALGLTPDTLLVNWAFNLKSNMTMGSTVPENTASPYTTKRKDSRATSSAWRQKLFFDEVKLVQSECLAMMGALGYRMLSSERELRNLTLSTLVRYSKGAIINP